MARFSDVRDFSVSLQSMVLQTNIPYWSKHEMLLEFNDNFALLLADPPIDAFGGDR